MSTGLAHLFYLACLFATLRLMNEDLPLRPEHFFPRADDAILLKKVNYMKQFIVEKDPAMDEAYFKRINQLSGGK
jgi:hypothetical protein